MQTKEQTLCSFCQNGTRLQLTEVLKPIEQIKHDQNWKPYKTGEIYWKSLWQVRLNRKIVHKSNSEYNERKVFATYCQNIVLQLKIY